MKCTERICLSSSLRLMGGAVCDRTRELWGSHWSSGQNVHAEEEQGKLRLIFLTCHNASPFKT